MSMTQTLAIIKPDAVERLLTGSIIEMIESNDFEITKIRKLTLSKEVAKVFYNVHEGKPFFDDLVEFMSSGPVVVLVLSGPNVAAIESDVYGTVASWRELIGETDPEESEPYTIRGRFGRSIDRNVVHGSDSDENAAREIEFFFGR